MNILFIILPFIFIMIAAMFNAAMDCMDVRYDRSIFSRYNPYFFKRSLSWKNKYIDNNPNNPMKPKIYQWLSDGWHIAKSLMVISICCSISCSFLSTWGINPWMEFGLKLCSLGTTWNMTFNAFFNKLLIIT